MPKKRDIDDFLAQRRITLVGISRDPRQFANKVYNALKERGYHLYPVNHNADRVEGDRCYPSVCHLPEQVEGALVMLPSAATVDVVRQCAEAGIPRVWLGQGTVSPEAVRLCREKGIAVIDGACPMMFAEPVGFAHRCHRFFMWLTGSLPR